MPERASVDAVEVSPVRRAGVGIWGIAGIVLWLPACGARLPSPLDGSSSGQGSGGPPGGETATSETGSPQASGGRESPSAGAGATGGSGGCRSDPSGTADCCRRGKGCFGGYFCELATCRCSPVDPCQATSTSSGGTSGAVPRDEGIGPDGGSIPALTFAIVGDTRPANPDETAGYPTGVITSIYQAIEAETPRPRFAIATGDYMFAIPGNGQALAQAQLYLGATQQFGGQVFLAMGNHECTGYTDSNCGAAGADGTPENYRVFVADMLRRGLGLTTETPYYAIHVNSSDPSNPWTAKLVFIAANAWDDSQSSWLSQVLAEANTYTFVVRHEPDDDNARCLGCGASDAIVKANPYTLLLVGHDHTYRWKRSTSELVVGIGGAPQSAPGPFGYVVCAQRADGNIACREIDVGSSSGSYANASIVVTPVGAQVQ